MKDPAERFQIFRILNIVNLIDPLEASTRDSKDPQVIEFRAAIGVVLGTYGTELITYLFPVSPRPCCSSDECRIAHLRTSVPRSNLSYLLPSPSFCAS